LSVNLGRNSFIKSTPGRLPDAGGAGPAQDRESRFFLVLLKTGNGKNGDDSLDRFIDNQDK
jgi:hypothetical protein